MCVQRKQTALHVAVAQRHKAVVLALLERGASLLSEDEVRGRILLLPDSDSKPGLQRAAHLGALCIQHHHIALISEAS
jgi:ankyrin repeat protein